MGKREAVDAGVWIPGVAWSKADMRLDGLEAVVPSVPIRLIRYPTGRVALPPGSALRRDSRRR